MVAFLFTVPTNSFSHVMLKMHVHINIGVGATLKSHYYRHDSHFVLASPKHMKETH